MGVLYYEEKIRLRTNDFDLRNNIKASAILDIFQDLGGAHADALGLGYNELFKKGYFWILLRTVFDVKKQPNQLSEVIISTWPHEKGRVDFNREYEIKSLDGEVLITGMSKWVIVDVNTRRIGKSDNIDYNGEHYTVNKYTDISKVNVEIPKQLTHELDYKVYKMDIDHNLHMNNARYADLILNTIENTRIASFKIEHINECKLNDIININSFNSDGYLYHIGYSNDKKVFVSQIKLEE